MSGTEAGIPLWDGLGPHHSGGGRDYFGVMHYRDVPHAEDRRDPTHRAYPVEYASALEAVAEAVDAWGQDIHDTEMLGRLQTAWSQWRDALAAAGSEASDG